MRRDIIATGAKVEGLSRPLVVASRVLFGLIGLLLVVAPWTEHYGTLDNFPHGQDFELSLLAFLALLCLVLVLAVQGKQGMRNMLTRRRRLVLLWEQALPPRQGVLDSEIERVSHAPPLRSVLSDSYNLPLVI